MRIELISNWYLCFTNPRLAVMDARRGLKKAERTEMRP